MSSNQTGSNSKIDISRPRPDYSDLLKIVACYYEMYSRAVDYVGPWIAKQRAGAFLPPDREALRAALGRERPVMHPRARSSFLDATLRFMERSKGRCTLVTPSPSSHHSAQFPQGTFEISPVPQGAPTGFQPRPGYSVYQIDFYGAESPVFFQATRFTPSDTKFIILRPKLGKLGVPSATKWEALLYKQPLGYQVDHVDSNLNPSYSGRF